MLSLIWYFFKKKFLRKIVTKLREENAFHETKNEISLEFSINIGLTETHATYHQLYKSMEGVLQNIYNGQQQQLNTILFTELYKERKLNLESLFSNMGRFRQF